ncbi:MAG: 4Fe-4S ferredoxin [Firmicutes bacterium HGW-Firmicutes-14]|nr:MAG: 4Fe-4S ferredoxin [Firmicutes bacterium HGW-Firmicutes-14]
MNQYLKELGKVRLVVYPDKCTGCGKCLKACAGSHGVARIGLKDSEKSGKPEPVACRQCKKPACARACTYELIERNRDTGAMTVDMENCQACHACVRACPFGSVFVHPDSDVALICDLCEGGPACVAACQYGALESRA